MNRRIVSGLFILLCIVVLGVLFLRSHSTTMFDHSLPAITSTSTMKLTSPAFNDQSPIPSLYTCDGKNVSPPLSISNVPAEAKSLVLLLEDPDAPVGIFDHWLVYDIDPKLTEIPEDSEPQGTHGKGSANNLTYMGPCPPSGTHRYLFTVYALDTKLSLPQGAAKIEVVNAMNGHVLEQAQLVGTYERAL